MLLRVAVWRAHWHPFKVVHKRIPHLLSPCASHSHTLTCFLTGSSGFCSIKNLPGAVTLNVWLSERDFWSFFYLLTQEPKNISVTLRESKEYLASYLAGVLSQSVHVLLLDVFINEAFVAYIPILTTAERLSDLPIHWPAKRGLLNNELPAVISLWPLLSLPVIKHSIGAWNPKLQPGSCYVVWGTVFEV